MLIVPNEVLDFLKSCLFLLQRLLFHDHVIIFAFRGELTVVGQPLVERALILIDAVLGRFSLEIRIRKKGVDWLVLAVERWLVGLTALVSLVVAWLQVAVVFIALYPLMNSWDATLDETRVISDSFLRFLPRVVNLGHHFLPLLRHKKRLLTWFKILTLGVFRRVLLFV